MSNLQLILLTLLPTAPRNPVDFNNDLKDLVISASDLTVADDIKGIPLGTASGVTTDPYFPDLTIVPGTAPHPDTLKTSIIQHFDKIEFLPPPPPPLPPIFIGVPYSVATAVIVVDIDTSPPNPPEYEYNSYDLRITIARGGKVVGSPRIEYNVPVQSAASLSVDPMTYINYVADNPGFPSAYVYVPPAPPTTSTNPSVPLGADGVTPVFDDLVNAINTVLAADHTSTATGAPTSLQDRALPLTAAQSHQVAWELTYDRTLLPLPVPKNKTLETMYSDPNVAAADDQDRKQFEGDLTSYHAIHDAEALKLSGYVFAASAAMQCERESWNAPMASFTFDIQGTLQTPQTSPPTVSVLLNGVVDATTNPDGRLIPTFVVPAAYFYALGATLPTQLSADDRFHAAVTNSEDTIHKSLQTALDAGVLNATEKTLTIATSSPDFQELDIDQAARRLSSLGSTNSSLPSLQLNSSISQIVVDWLTYPGKTADIDAFWKAEVSSQPDEYLELLLQVITAEKTDLKTAIKNTLGVKKADDLLTITDKQWRDFFLPAVPPATPVDAAAQAALLPQYTEPGNPQQRTDAFINDLKKLLTMKVDTGSTGNPNPNDVPILDPTRHDAVAQFLAQYPSVFSFDDPLDESKITSTLSSVFPTDSRLQSWTNEAIHTIHLLYQITKLPSPNTPSADLQFSYMEALYARGFITADRIAFLSDQQFQSAVAGTVAYSVSSAIYNLATPLATSSPDTGPEPGTGFTPINPGDLVDCIPPPNLSPLGPIEYLHEMLKLTIGTSLLGDILSQRCGPIGNLKATIANLETSIPLVDLVNEGLEAMGSDLSLDHGAVYDTNSDTLAGFSLGAEPKELDAEAMFDAIPEHSTPAIPVESPSIYDTLKKDFSAPSLPYAQDLDISRTYLCRSGTSRFETMRHFRKDITEFALDPANEPADFQRNLWRFPVRLDIAIEYLCISPDELTLLYTTTLDQSCLAQIYGFNSDIENWWNKLLYLPVFLERTGLTYCEFLELWKCGFVQFGPGTEENTFPACPPCCMKSIRLSFYSETPIPGLQKLAVFIRLWRQLECCFGKGCISFPLLADICEVLQLFNGDDLNDDFIRQLAALFMLREFFHLPLREDSSPMSGQTVPPEQRVKLLALWVDPTTSPEAWKQAVHILLDCIEDYAKREFHCPERTAEFKKIIIANLPKFARLVGFTDDHSWHSTPVCTLRFGEILAKFYASEYTIGELLFLFTNHKHLLGDDPFPYTEESESVEDPLNVPEDSHHGLWKLRKKLLEAEVEKEVAKEWTWRRIENTLRTEFRIPHSTDPNIPDPLRALGEHFFPCTLETHGHRVPVENKQFRTPLPASDTTVLMWESLPNGPFQYHTTTSELSTELPLRDQDVLKKLSNTRQLKPVEQEAVRQLYFAPRSILAPFALLFANFSHAVDYMIQEPCEADRFGFFQKDFALFHRRCKIIAEHLAEQVDRLKPWCKDDKQHIRCETDVAWRVLRSLFADENRPTVPWENDSGVPPDHNTFLWDPTLSGSAFAALLGLVGTGLLGEYSAGGPILWREIRGPLTAFGRDLDERNVAVPTVIPWLNILPSTAQQAEVIFRNGFALRDGTAEFLGGAAPFSVTWTGILLVEHTGDYRFKAERPHLHDHEPHNYAHRHQEHHHEHHRHSNDDRKWSITVRRGKKTWTLLNHKQKTEEHAPSHESLPVCLSRGAYEIAVEYEQMAPEFLDDCDIHPTHTGFTVKYCGPDSEDQFVDLPRDKLFIKSKDAPLNQGMDKQQDNTILFLKQQYVSTIRDIRRTYQRAFKAILFVHRFCLLVEPNEYCHGNSELGFFLDHPANFLGTSYYRKQLSADKAGKAFVPYISCHAYFDFNFLPVHDAYMPPAAAQDDRVNPSPQRMSALFDWWERISDYCRLRHEVRHRCHDKHSHGPVWLLFYDAAVQQPSDATTLVRHLGFDMSLAPLVLTYYDNYVVSVADLEDERWSIRVWHGMKLLDRLQEVVYTRSLGQARPDLWASDQRNLAGTTAIPPVSGNQNLTHFFQQSCIVDSPVRLFHDIRELNNGLRERARKALIAYLCRMERVPMPGIDDQSFATTPQDLSDLLLHDVEVDLCQHSTRIDDAIQAVQTFVQRVRLGLEPSYQPVATFVKTWDSAFCSFEKWKNWQRRRLYSENWIQWKELQQARESEAFQFLEKNITRHALTAPSSTSPFVLDTNGSIPNFSMLEKIQSKEFAPESSRVESLAEGIDLIGTARDAQPSWLSPVSVPSVAIIPTKPTGNNGNENRGNAPTLQATMRSGTDEDQIPLWFKAAVRLGTRFVRVAAAGLPPAMNSSSDFSHDFEQHCKCQCGKEHAPVVDEYYFWLTSGKTYDLQDFAIQGADVGSIPPDPTSDWDRADTLPTLLQWPARAMLHLTWTRVHLGAFEPPRRADEGIPVGPNDSPTLSFQGRQADSLLLGAFSSTTGGFRYDISTDAAVIEPALVADTYPTQALPTPLSAYPYFIYFTPGAPLVPIYSFGTALAVAGMLRTQCCFEAALSWCRAAFDPLQRNNRWAQCPTKAPPSSLVQNAHDSDFVQLPPGQDGPCCPTAPVKSGIARGRAVVLEYLEILLQWGDSLMCRNSIESVQQAAVLFNEAARILGPQPFRVDAQDRKFGEPITVAEFQASMPVLNPRLMNLFEKIADRRSMVQHCLNARRLRNGHRRKLGSDHRRECAYGSSKNDMCEAVEDCISCCLPYRFTSLLPKAVELVNVVKSLGGELLSAYEKGDSEYLAALRQTHDRQILDLTLEIKQLSFRESDWQVQVLEKQMEGAQTRLRFNNLLLKNGLNPGETGYVSGTNVALGSRVGANVIEGVSQGMAMIPDITLGGAGVGGSPVEINSLPIGTKLAGAFQTAARILNTVGDISSTGASLSNTSGGWQRRSDEWQHQVDIISLEIQQIKRQQLAADRRREISLRDLNNHQQQMEHSADIQDLMRDKFTKQDLYLFLQQETATLYRQVYDLALQTARDAEQAFRHERKDVVVELPVFAWDDLHQGLMAGERLDFALRSMERLYMKTNCREYELTKHISLKLQFPLAFLQLKALGWCEIEIPEWMFDLDYPGQYMRRIKNVSVTIPCVVGPYVGVHCRLELLSSGIRMDPSLSGPHACCCKDQCGDQKESRYDDYHHLSRNFIGSEAIATSSGQNDAGLFELNFRDERFVPFEFSGAVSRWRIEIPPRNNQFDLETLSDFVMHLNYTSREGGSMLRRVADECAQRHLPGGGVRFFDVRHEFPENWRSVFVPGRGFDKGKHTKKHHDFPLRFTRRMFPFLTGRRSVNVTSLHIFIEVDRDIDFEEHITVGYLLDEHGRKDTKCLTCVAASDMPWFYHGVLELNLGPVIRDEFHTVGLLRFPQFLGRVRQVYFLCHYNAQEEDGGLCKCEHHRSEGHRGVCGKCGGKY